MNQQTSSHAWKGRWYKLMEGVRRYLRNASDDTCVWIGKLFFVYWLARNSLRFLTYTEEVQALT